MKQFNLSQVKLVALLKDRRLHMGARGEETSAVHRSGEPVTTKLRRIAEKALTSP